MQHHPHNQGASAPFNPPQTMNIETHPFPPVLPPNATVMMSGSFPPTAEKRSMEFHYPNYQNDMWRVYGTIYYNDPKHFEIAGEKRFDAARIRAFLEARGIAICPSVRRAIREKGNAADAHLRIIETLDLPTVVAQLPRLRHLCTTGGKATEVLLGFTGIAKAHLKTGETLTFHLNDRELTLTRLPSTSRAYPLKLEQKIAAYRAFFQRCGLIPA